MQNFDFITFIQIFGSSSLGCALVNLWWSFYLHRSGEKEKKMKAGHVYFEIHDVMADFVVACSSRIGAINSCLFQFDDNGEEYSFPKLNNISLSLPQNGSWKEISVGVVQKTRRISKRFSRTDTWIRTLYKREEWVEVDQAYELEIQRLSFYGVEACNLIDEIESLTPIEHEDLSVYKNIFVEKLKAVEDSFKKNPDKLIIPELKERFSKNPG